MRKAAISSFLGLLLLLTFHLDISDGQTGEVARVEQFLGNHCSDLSRLLRPLCRKRKSPACCTMFDIVDMCSGSCSGASSSINSMMHDPTTCSQLQLAGKTVCVSDESSSCRALRCLMTLLCLDGQSTCDGSTAEVKVARMTQVRRHRESRMFELPEMRACEATDLIPFDKDNIRECPPTVVTTTCGEKFFKYRSIDGLCNNLFRPDWGRSFHPPKRLLPPVYDDGEGIPRKKGISGNPLKSARFVSRYISPETEKNTQHSVMLMAWGQFIDHDITGFPVIKISKDLKCCAKDLEPGFLVENGGPCFPITINDDDDFFVDKRCMEFVRSNPADDEDGNLLSPREQINGLTSFIDASTVYGSDKEVFDFLRASGGRLRVSANNMLPRSKTKNCKIVNNSTDFCLIAGDHRVNVFVGLQVFHTVFHRLHNQLVDGLAQINRHWNDETLFQEARKIVSALHQHVTYNEYLPACLSMDTMDKYRLWVGDYQYNQNVQPDMSNVFSTAAFRFGHSQIQPLVKVGTDFFRLEDTLSRPHLTLTRFDEVVDGMASSMSEDVDNFFVEAVTDKMFEKNPSKRDGLDLVSLNVQRGRDHGLPSYNEYRKYCGLTKVTTFDPVVFMQAQELSHVYEDPDDIDVFIGGTLERHLPGSLVGPLFACLIGQQFHDVKFGDRFFYETQRLREGFTPAQLKEIKAQTTTSILCQTTGVTRLQQKLMHVFQSSDNPMVHCGTTPRINLDFWAETP